MPQNNRLAPRANALADYIPAPSTPGLPQVDPRLSRYQYAENISYGLGEGLTNQLRGIEQLVRSPVATFKEQLAAIGQLVDDPMLALQMLRELRQRAAAGPLGFGEVVGELLPTPGRRPSSNALRITEPQAVLDEAGWHGSPNPAFERFDPAVKGEGRAALGPGHYVGEKGYAEVYAGQLPGYTPRSGGSLTQWRPTLKNSVYFGDEGFSPNTPRANAANRKAFQAVKKVDPKLAYRVFKIDRGKIVGISAKQLKYDANGKPFWDFADFNRAMDIAGIDSVVDITLPIPGFLNKPAVHQIMVRDPANLTRVK